MKKILIAILLTMSLSLQVWAETKLGASYLVIRDDSPYVSVEGDPAIKTLNKGKKVRLIHDDSILETVVWAPIRVFSLMFTIKPRGNWLVEDEQGNRGYMWESDLELIKNK